MKDKRAKIVETSPLVKECIAGTYYWCSCGYSKNQPFCDGTHREKSELKSVRLDLSETTVVAFCMCKQTRTPPFCDGSHRHCFKEK